MYMYQVEYNPFAFTNVFIPVKRTYIQVGEISPNLVGCQLSFVDDDVRR